MEAVYFEWDYKGTHHSCRVLVEEKEELFKIVDMLNNTAKGKRNYNTIKLVPRL